MPAYYYEALDGAGQVQKGVLEGDSPRQVRDALREKAWLPIVVQASHERSKHKKHKTPNAYELALLTRQLSTLTASSIALEEALQAVAQHSERLALKSLILSMRQSVLEGHSLAHAFAMNAEFPPLYVATIAAGERSGHLDLILSQLADYTESRHALQRKVRTAMIYPLLLMVVSFAVVMGLMSFVVPKIVAVFEDSEQRLPLLTEIVLGLSQLVSQWWWLILLLLTIFVTLMAKFVKTQGGRAWVDAWVLRLPVFGKLSRAINAARFASTLAILGKSGVPLVEGLSISAEVVGNVHIANAIKQMCVKVTEGASMTSQLMRHDYFPPMMVQMIKSGEQSGELNAMLSRAAAMQDDEATSFITGLLALLSPAMLIFMGLVVGAIIMAVMLPIISMNELLG